MVTPIESVGSTTIATRNVTEAQQQQSDSNIDTFFDKAVSKLKEYENKFQAKLDHASNPNSAVMRMPDYITDEIKRLELEAKTDEERALVDRFARGVTETFEANREFYIGRMESKMDSIQMKMGAQFVSNTVKGVQQLLSSS